MIAASLAIVMVGLLLLALIVRDAWIRTLEARRREKTETDQNTLVALGRRCEGIEGTLKDHHERLLRAERERPAPRRA